MKKNKVKKTLQQKIVSINGNDFLFLNNKIK